MDSTAATPLRLLTHNIRYATTHPFPNESPWPIRAPLMLNELRFTTRHCPAALICLQEVLNHQLTDIMSGLNSASLSVEPEWAYVGVARDDGKTAGEYGPILFRKAVWQLEEVATRWLSETPDRPSMGWDATCFRIVTIAVLRHRVGGGRVIMLNTHLDDQGAVARRKGAVMIVQYAKEWRSKYKGAKVSVAGDFNSEVDGDAYKEMVKADSGFEDVRGRVPEPERFGEWCTFTGFGDQKKTRIDFLFVGKEDGWRVDGYGVLPNRFEAGVWVSDHRAVVADVVMGGG